MKVNRFRPRVFISYAREDKGLAQYLHNKLGKHKYHSWYDVERILVGDDFVTEIVSNLSKTDGVILLISPDSVLSVWCQAEWYYAHAMNKIMMPVRIRGGVLSPDLPISYFQRSVNYFEAKDETSYEEIWIEINRRLHQVKNRFRQRLLKAFVAIIGFLLIILFGVTQINVLSRSGERDQAASEVLNAPMVISSDWIKGIAAQFLNDEELGKTLLLYSRSLKLTPLQRINCGLVTNAIIPTQRNPEIVELNSLNWHNSNIDNFDLTNFSLIDGELRDIKFQQSKFGGVVWGSASGTGIGLKITNIEFLHCVFNAGVFDGTELINGNFENCKFYGTKFKLNNFSEVRFVTNNNDTLLSKSHVSGDNTFFHFCSFENIQEPLPPYVIEIVPERSEVYFNNVIFDGCQFKGLSRAEWFTSCTFVNCVFPNKKIIQDLEEKGCMLMGKISAPDDYFL